MDRQQTKTFAATSPGQVHAPSPPGRKPKLLDQLRQALRSRHYSRRTEQTYCPWVKRFIYFHDIRHPAEMAEPEINGIDPVRPCFRFLSHHGRREKQKTGV
jgi:hypothetical protein